MESTIDIHVELSRIQSEIEHHIGLKGSGIVFEYRQIDGNKVQLDLITVNPRHNQSFLFRSERGHDKVDALQRMLDYVKNYKDKENSYTVQWVVKGSDDLQTSYFRAGNIYDALDKLYYGRDMHTITVFSVVLNPTA